jgi:hypothetical protein
MVLDLLKITNSLAAGEELGEILNLSASILSSSAPIVAISIYLKDLGLNGEFKEIFTYGGKIPFLDERLSLTEDPYYFTESDLTYTFKLASLGLYIGTIEIKAKSPLAEKLISDILVLGSLITQAIEKDRLTTRVQNFIERLQTLNGLHQLIATNVDVDRIVKNVSYEAAFRFNADICFTYVLDSSKEFLELRGGYGIDPKANLPKNLSPYGDTLGRVMQLGSHLAIQNLNILNDSELEFLINERIVSVDISSFAVRDGPLGLTILGFKESKTLNSEDVTKFEELSRLAGVAIANARNQEQVLAYANKLEELVAVRTEALQILQNLVF